MLYQAGGHPGLVALLTEALSTAWLMRIIKKSFHMNKEQYYNVHLGEFITRLQRIIQVDGRLLRDEDIVAGARISKSTYQQIKKGKIRNCMVTMMFCAFT